MKQIVIPVPGVPPAPADAKARWWIIGAFDERGRAGPVARIVAGPGTVQFVPQVVAQAVAIGWPHVVVTTGEPDHETVYETSGSRVLVDRLSEFA